MITTPSLDYQIYRPGFWSAIVAIALAAQAPSLTSAQTSDYRAVMEFQEYCASCHETPAPGTIVPTRAELKAMPPTKIFDSMTVGKG